MPTPPAPPAAKIWLYQEHGKTRIDATEQIRDYAAALWDNARTQASERKTGRAMQSKQQIDRIILAIEAGAALLAHNLTLQLQPTESLKTRLAKTTGQLTATKAMLKQATYDLANARETIRSNYAAAHKRPTTATQPPPTPADD